MVWNEASPHYRIRHHYLVLEETIGIMLFNLHPNTHTHTHTHIMDEENETRVKNILQGYTAT